MYIYIYITSTYIHNFTYLHIYFCIFAYKGQISFSARSPSLFRQNQELHPLHVAVRQCDAAIVKMLLEAGACLGSA